MLILDSVNCGDQYTPAATLGPVFESNGGYFLVSGNDAFVQIGYGKRGRETWMAETHVTTGAGVLSPGVIAVRFRNHAAGSGAVVSAGLTSAQEPVFVPAAAGAQPPPPSAAPSGLTSEQAYAAAVLADAPYLYWQCQEASGQLQDSSGNGRPSTTATSLSYQQAGPFADGSAKAIEKPSGGSASRTSGSAAVNNVTLEAWIKPVSGLGSNRTLVANHNGAAGGWDIIMTTATKFAVVVQGVAILANCTANLAAGSWYYIVAMREATIWKYYVNGFLDTANAGTSAPASAAAGTLGIDSAGSAIDFVCAHFAYYETALSAARVAAHFSAGT